MDYDNLPQKVIDNFWLSITNTNKTDECWNWTGKTQKDGLPIIYWHINNPKRTLAYQARRVSVRLFNSLNQSRQVIPSCGNKLCVNPKHLLHEPVARFWNQVKKLGDEIKDCWTWTGLWDKDMYGEFFVPINGKTIHYKAHQYSWKLYTGRNIPKGILLCHACDHPWCVNPHHLFLGTAKDNADDMKSKGRSLAGELNPQAKLTEIKVREIRELFLAGKHTKKQLSDLYGVTQTLIGRITSNKSWRHIV